jgi:FixJ family two-component response regulator
MTGTCTAEAPPAAVLAPAPHAAVFVIDDDDVMLLSCRRVLEHDGYEVETFDNGQEGIARLQKSGPSSCSST